MIDKLQGALREFAAVRDWGQFHTRRTLVLALTGEDGDLAELMQWKTDEQLAADHAPDCAERAAEHG